jgi:uncharacterized membrane protein YeiH
MFETLTTALDWFGIIVFAVTGALVASRKQMDMFGFALLGTVTGVGGGTVRDLLLGRSPVFWVGEPAYLVVCVAVSTLVFFTAHIPESRYRLLLWLDAAGLGLFAAVGAETGLDSGHGTIVAVVMGVITATFGGILRDVLGGESPVVLRREIYVTAALVGACATVLALRLAVPHDVALLAGASVGFAVRGVALRRGWSLPVYRARPGRRPEDLGL